MPVRTSSAVWNGDLQKGSGEIKLGSGAFQGQYSFGSRFEDQQGTNPEELIGAAEAGCFSMALAYALGKAGFPAQRIETTADVSIEKVGDAFRITRILLKTEAEVPKIEEEAFRQHAETAKKECPVSQALAGTEIKLESKLAR